MRAPKPSTIMSEEAEKPSETSADSPTEIPVTTDAAAGEGAAAETAPEAPADPLEAALVDAAEWKDLAARSQAELDNYRKRMAREKSDAIKFANAGLLGDLLPVLDNFQMGLDAAKAEAEDSVITRGMAMVRKQLDDFLSSTGVTEINAVGEAFDPNQHDAISQEHSDEVPEGQIISQVRAGYRLHDRLLRAANVVVSKGPQAG